jgi:hypothetical protein
MPSHTKANIVRRSIAVPAAVVEAARAAAPPHLRDNLNRLTITALEEYAARRRAERFGKEMARMASDSSVRAECDAIATDFARADADGLGE